MRRILAVLMVVTIALLSAGCASSKSSSSPSQPATSASQSSSSTGASTATTHFAKTKFVLHAGLAFGAFHRYIYKPLKAGKFSGGLLHHKLATLKAAVAAAFAYHEIKLALADARSSQILSKALSPLLALQTKLSSLTSGLKHGNADSSAIESANGSASQVSTAGSSAGQPVTDQPTPQLGG